MEFERFDFEQRILSCWRITDDIETVLLQIEERDISQDQLANILLGMKALYDIKFGQLFDMFENGVSSKKIK